MEQAGATQRQQMAGDVTREGNLLDFNARNRATDASLIERPSFVTDADRRYLRVGANGAAPVTDAAGNASAPGSDSATVGDMTAPAAPTVTSSAAVSGAVSATAFMTNGERMAFARDCANRRTSSSVG